MSRHKRIPWGVGAWLAGLLLPGLLLTSCGTEAAGKEQTAAQSAEEQVEEAAGEQVEEAAGEQAKEAAEAAGENAELSQQNAAPIWSRMDVERSMELLYAEQFSVDYYAGGYARITISEAGEYLVVPENAPVPEGLPEGMTVLQQPLQHIYLAATSAMDLFRGLDGIGNVTLSGLEASGWYVEEAREAMEAGSMVYAGKYSTPDYERILADGCDLAVESTMIYHVPEVKEQLERLGIPVLVERSSYESQPLGRMEWLKLYAVLLGKEDQAEELFADQAVQVEAAAAEEKTQKTVAFFYITSNGSVNVRKSGDYVAKMIDLAGGTYVPQELEQETENALSTMNMQMEAFYAAARDADVLIYNSTIDGELQTMEEFLAKSGLLKDFRAVQEGNVWCTGKNMFQESMGTGEMILEIHTILKEENPAPEELTYLHRLQ